MAEETKNIVVAARVKDLIKNAVLPKDFEGELRVGGDVADALNAKVEALLGDAIQRAIKNGRKTVQPQDL